MCSDRVQLDPRLLSSFRTVKLTRHDSCSCARAHAGWVFGARRQEIQRWRTLRADMVVLSLRLFFSGIYREA